MYTLIILILSLFSRLLMRARLAVDQTHTILARTYATAVEFLNKEEDMDIQPTIPLLHKSPFSPGVCIYLLALLLLEIFNTIQKMETSRLYF